MNSLSKNTNAEPGTGDINVMVKPSSLKNKTPMCLINELARYNRIQHQYVTKKEDGPAHHRKFTVVLKLCEEEYEAQSTSIKKAQHEAAAIAIRNTKYRHPPVKLLSNTRKDVTPTVQLNALSMKRALPLSYTLLNQPSNFFQPTFPINYCNRNIYQSRTVYNEYNSFNEINVMNRYSSYNGSSYNESQFNPLRFKCSQSMSLVPPSVTRPFPYKISLKVGDREFIAEANDVQTARHEAAKVAVNELLADSVDGSKSEEDELLAEDSKSPISAVYEKAFRHDLHVVFEVIDEHGPPHMRAFVTECRVGDQFKTVGEGNSKKISKKRAAAKMISVMEILPPTPKVSPEIEEKRRLRKKIQFVKKRNCLLNKSPSNGMELESSTEVNPITRLMEYQRKKHAKEPVYVIVDEKGKGRKKQFTMEIRIDELRCTAVGTSKKEAKLKASQEMLKLLGLKTNTSKDDANSAESKSTENEVCVNSTSFNGKQLAPGLFLIPNVNEILKNSKNTSISNDIKVCDENGNGAINEVNGNSSDNEKLYNGINNEVLNNGIAHLDDLDHTASLAKNQEQYFSLKHKIFSNVDIQKHMAKDQLMQIAHIFGYEVQFSDFPKGHHHREFLSLVTLNTNPPQTCYGSGDTTESAQNEAAFNALSMISEIGVDTLFTKKISAYTPEKEIAS